MRDRLQNSLHHIDMREHQLLSFLQEDQNLRSLRVKEILAFLVGYTLCQLTVLCRNIKISIHSNIKIYSMIDQISIRMNNQVSVSKGLLIKIFSIALAVIKQKYSQLNDLPLRGDFFIFQHFKSLIKFGLQAKIQKINLHTYFSEQLDQFMISLTNKTQDIHYGNSLKQNEKILNLFDGEIVKKNTQSNKLKENILCEICYFPLRSKYDSVKQTTKITKCEHEYHTECLFQTIKEYMKSNSEILLNPNLVKQDPTVTKQQQTYRTELFTRIKCPKFDECSVHLKLEQVHNALLNSSEKSQKLSKQFSQSRNLYLDKLYELTFNDYLTKNGIKSFDELKNLTETFETQSQQIFAKDKILFYCQTNGCNAIYQIDNPSLKEKSKQISNLQLFICISCRSPFCLKCFSSLHPSMTCREYSISSSRLPQDQELQKFIKTLKKPYKRCPKCRFYVDNWRGCSTVKCRCGTEFCFKCGNIGCPHAKCLKDIEKQAKEKEENQKVQETKNKQQKR